MTQEKAVATVDQKAKTVRHMLTVSKEQISMALPKHVTADRLIRVAMTSIQRTPKLLDCDQKSLMAAIMQSAQLGLMPDGVLGEAYLIPFDNKRKNITEVQFIIGYRGLISLARRSGEIVSLAAHCVHKNDTFEFEYGLDEKLRHVPNMLGDRGQLVAVYAVAKLRDGGYAIEVMSRKDVEAIRNRSQGYRSAVQYKKDHPWITDFDQMARKTALRRLSKYLPVSVEMLEAIAIDEQTEAGRQITTVDNGNDLLPTSSLVEDLNDRFGSKGEIIDATTGEIIEDGASRNKPESKMQGHPPQEESPTDQQNPAEEEPTGPSEIVKSEMREINRAVESGGSLAVDQWRMKHHNRVAKKCGGTDSADYKAIMEHCDIAFRTAEENEAQGIGQQ